MEYICDVFYNGYFSILLPKLGGVFSLLLTRKTSHGAKNRELAPTSPNTVVPSGF